MTENIDTSGYLTGQVLVAMPQMEDPRFARSVVYVCAHTPDGAMGLVVNKLVDSVTFPDLLEQLNLRGSDDSEGIHVHFGGPVETGRGPIVIKESLEIYLSQLQGNPQVPVSLAKAA